MGADPIRARYAKLGTRVAEALRSRFFDAWYFDEPRAAVEQLFALIPQDHVISWGGSLTVAGLGVQHEAVRRGYRVIDRDAAPSPEARNELMRQALLSDTYLMGTNALSEDGQLVNIDGGGNRVAALCYGPRQVIVMAGMNKVAKTLEDALTRARTQAAPANAQRFPANKTPCGETGSCANCRGADSICSVIVTTRLCKPAGRIKVLLIGQDLGL